MTEIKYIFPKQLQSVAVLAFIDVLIFVLSRRKFYDLLNNTDGEDFLAYYGERKLIPRVAFERYLHNHPELRRRV